MLEREKELVEVEVCDASSFAPARKEQVAAVFCWVYEAAVVVHDEEPWLRQTRVALVVEHAYL
jgi:hypothetical protein